MILLSIDPGTETGIAEWDIEARRFLRIQTTTLWRAACELRDNLARPHPTRPDLVLLEDARKMRVGRGVSTYGQMSRLQGVGSVKRDCVLWVEILDSLAIPYVATAPTIGLTKIKAVPFAQLTGWQGKTSSHGRDAAMRALNYNATMARAMVMEWRQRRAA